MTSATPTPAAPARRSAEAPGLIRRSTPLANRLLSAGMPMGPNVLLTVRGRVSGEPRTAPVALIAIKGSRFVIGAYGDVQWIRNLRAAGEAELRIKGETLHVTAGELDQAAATTFYGETLPRYIAAFPWFGRAFAKVFFRLIGPELADDPERAATLHPVFELRG